MQFKSKLGYLGIGLVGMLAGNFSQAFIGQPWFEEERRSLIRQQRLQGAYKKHVGPLSKGYSVTCLDDGIRLESAWKLEDVHMDGPIFRRHYLEKNISSEKACRGEERSNAPAGEPNSITPSWPCTPINPEEARAIARVFKAECRPSL